MRFNCSHAINVLPLPPKTSSTISPSLLLDLIARLHNAIGFGVACPPHNSLSVPFVREHAVQFYNHLIGLCRVLRYDYINDYIYIFTNSDTIQANINFIVIKSPFEYPHLIKTETVESAGSFSDTDYDDSEELDDNEFLLPEDMIGNIKDIIFKRNLLNVARETNETPVENLVR